jgi:hypothetical protein
LKTINTLILLSIIFSAPAFAEDNKRPQGGAEHTPNPTMQADRQALQADREKMREDHQKLHEEREKKRDDRRAEHEQRMQQHQENRNGGRPGEPK